MTDTHTYEEGLSTANEKPSTCGEKFKKGLKDNLFTIFTLIGVIIGFAIGFGVGKLHPSETAITWIGECFPPTPHVFRALFIDIL